MDWRDLARPINLDLVIAERVEDFLKVIHFHVVRPKRVDLACLNVRHDLNHNLGGLTNGADFDSCSERSQSDVHGFGFLVGDAEARLRDEPVIVHLVDVHLFDCILR